MIPDYYAKCYASHMGVWAVRLEWFDHMLASVQQGLLTPMAQADQQAQRDAARAGYVLRSDGTALIPIHGHLTKGGDSFGAGSTVMARQQIRHALRADGTARIMLHVSSPGGHVAGTDALAHDVRIANNIKPVYAHLEDEGASAAYYIPSQARRITASRDTMVGSIGVLLVVDDSSQLMDAMGVTRHVLSTGEYKGAGVPGTEITEAHLAHFQDLVDGYFSFFRESVMAGRQISQEQFNAVSDGRVFFAEEAQRLGLIDGVMSFEQALGEAARNGG